MLIEQLVNFLYIIFAGLLTGFIYDFYRILRKVLKLKKTWLNIGDLCFWLFLTIFIFGLLLLINYGELRFYVFIGLILGIILYFKLLSDLSIKIINFLLKIVYQEYLLFLKVVSVIWKIITFPIVFPFQYIVRSLKAIKKIRIIPPKLKSFISRFMKLKK